jgi:hypothetical protein
MIHRLAISNLKHAELKLRIIQFDYPGLYNQIFLTFESSVKILKAAISNQNYPLVFKQLKDLESFLKSLSSNNLLVEWDLYGDIRKTACALEVTYILAA